MESRPEKKDKQIVGFHDQFKELHWTDSSAHVFKAFLFEFCKLLLSEHSPRTRKNGGFHFLQVLAGVAV